LVVAQVAVSLFLLIGAGLVTRSVDAARNADMGFDASGVALTRLNLRPNGYDDARGLAFFKQLLENVRADTAIDSATLAVNTPLTMVDSGAVKVTIDGYDPGRDEDLTFLSNVVAPDYFRTLKIGLLAGREFESRDDAAAMPAIIVNETLGRRFWGSAAAAVGKRIRVSAGEWRTVIGVVRDIKYSRFNEGARPYVYLPFLQAYQSSAVLHVRGAVSGATPIEQVRAHIAALDPDLPILSTGTLRELTQGAFLTLQMVAGVLFLIGVAGMALAAMGIYGLVSYTVRQSTHEIGIRIALGARGGEVVRHFLRRGLSLGVIGVVVGAVAALAVTRLLGSVLFGVSATDPISFAGALAVVLGTVLIATVVPAWQAARTSPLAALRQK
jgi:putative ABC transport system permease protein